MKAKPVPVKKLLLVTAAGAVAVMGAVTVASTQGDTSPGGSAVVIADTETQRPPPSKPSVPSAAPRMKAAPWRGDWRGF